MNDSLRLLLEDFLGLMREEGELDAYLPLLISAMGHEIVYRAQKGPRQYGVDICSVGRDEDGVRKLILWLVKCGDIGRNDWNSGPQSVRQSIDDVGDVYLHSHVAPQHARLPRKLLIVTNGDFNAALNQTIASFLTAWSKSHGVETATVNGSTLASWTERYLLDEHVLPAGGRSLLRRMLANVSAPELSVAVGRTLFDQLVGMAKRPAKSDAARKKVQLTALRGIRTALRVLHAWALNEENLLAPYRLAEYAVLCVWSGLHQEMKSGHRHIAREFAELVFQMAAIGESYHEAMQPYYVTQGGLAHVFPDSLLVSDAAFVELGRLGAQGVTWAHYAVLSHNPMAEGLAEVYVNRVCALLESHACTRSPPYDRNSTDIHVALLLLLIGGRRAQARAWVGQLTERLGFAVKTRKYWPLTAQFEDALAIRHGDREMDDEFIWTSTLVPILLLWSAVFGMPDVYAALRTQIVPLMPKTTLNFWSSDVGFDGLVADPVALQAHGVGEAVLDLPEDPAEFLSRMGKPLPGVQSIEDADWYQQRVAYVPLLAALHWRLQVPRQLLVKHAVALAAEASDDDAGVAPAASSQALS